MRDALAAGLSEALVPGAHGVNAIYQAAAASQQVRFSLPRADAAAATMRVLTHG